MMLDPFLVFEHRRVRLRAGQIPASFFPPFSHPIYVDYYMLLGTCVYVHVIINMLRITCNPDHLLLFLCRCCTDGRTWAPGYWPTAEEAEREALER